MTFFFVYLNLTEMIKKIHLILFLTLFPYLYSISQEAVSAGGGTAVGAGGTVSYTIGQLAYTSIEGASGSLYQGIQYPYEISIVTEMPEGKHVILHFETFPNPTSDYLILSIDGELDGEYNYRLFDVAGKLVEDKSITFNQSKIEMKQLVTGVYILKVFASNIDGLVIVKTFKIIKN